MRQAGRYLPSYRRVRREMGVIEMSKDPEVSSAVAAGAAKELGVDAAIIFADIMLPLEGMGVGFEIRENVGPVVRRPVRTGEDVAALRGFSAGRDVPFVMEGIRRLREMLDGQVALIGFSGAPFTLASYMIEGGPARDFALTKAMMYGDPDAWKGLMERLSSMVRDYLAAQISAGAEAVQLFDSWAGCLSPEDYARYVLPYTARAFDGLGAVKIHFCAQSSHLIERLAETGADVLSVDWRIPIGDVWGRTGEGFAVQGNLDPAAASAGGKGMEERVEAIMKAAEGHRGHIFSLGHGVLKETPPENLRRIVDIVHGYGG